MASDEATAKWQAKLDADFPNGAVIAWHRASGSTVYPVSWIRVDGMSGLDPNITLFTYGDDRLVGPMRMVTYEDARDGRKKATFEGIDDEVLYLNSKVPDGIATSMAQERTEYIKIWRPEGGSTGL